ncbi:MAG: cobyrinate a,c-diamide synthase [Thermoplasmata archaeon]|nr:cobyrinate a,c-diamide synthase [Thermoplasmata archaeon]
MSLPRFLIAAPASGSGKTLVTCGLLQALVNRGLKVASFKCGPDYIDPMFHSRVIGTRSKNLDAYFVDDPTLRYLFGRTAEQCDISVVEGVMGFYDGVTFDGTFASSCDVSNRLDIPVVLLVNARGSSLSTLAVLKGFLDFAENNIRGVIFNQMSARVYSALAPKVREMGIEPIGYVPKVTDLVLESRHLGLVLPGEIESLREKLNKLADVLEESLDIDLLIKMAGSAPNLEYAAPEVGRVDGNVRIGLADDDTFCFTYEDNVELLERCGAEIVRFSPMKDAELPDVDGIVLSGGYPELHGEELEANRSMLEDIRQKVAAGMPCIAECGGFMYLHETMEDRDGVMRKMCGVIPGKTWNTGKLCRFGYVTLGPVNEDGMLGTKTTVKGHEFHYWDSESNGDDWEASKKGTTYRCMHDTGTVLAGYPHLYYYSNPEVALAFVRRCAEYRNG